MEQQNMNVHGLNVVKDCSTSIPIIVVQRKMVRVESWEAKVLVEVRKDFIIT